MTNHPVHIVDQDQKLSPTALIPFCEFSGHMSVMGVKIDQFDVPVCNSFQDKIVKDQLCYELDPNRFRSTDPEMFLTFFIDHNEDRQFTVSRKNENLEENDLQHFVSVETIGM